jgi:hypothetical protein
MCFWRNKEYTLQNQLLCATSLISVGTQLIAAIVIISLTFSMTNKTKGKHFYI